MEVDHQATKPKRVITKLCAQAARAHIRAWREDGLSLPDYCHQHGIAKSTFYGWVERYERKAPKGFSPVLPKAATLSRPSPSSPSTVPKQTLDITLPNGITIYVDNLKHSAQVIQFIKGLL